MFTGLVDHNRNRKRMSPVRQGFRRTVTVATLLVEYIWSSLALEVQFALTVHKRTNFLPVKPHSWKHCLIVAIVAGADFKTNVEMDEDIKKYLSVEEIEACFDPKPMLKHIDLIMARFGL